MSAVDRRQRQALRELDERRVSVRWANTVVVLATVFSIAVATGWALVLMWMRGWPLFGAIVGLLIVTGLAIFAVGYSYTYLFDSRRGLRKAQYAYEDALLEDR